MDNLDIAGDLMELDESIKSQRKLVQELIKKENLRRDKKAKDKRRFGRQIFFAMPKEIKDAQSKLKLLISKQQKLREAFFRNDTSSRIDKVPWDFITFFDRYITIQPAETLLLRVSVKESRASFNFIKNLIASRLEPIQVEWNVTKTKILDQIYFAEILTYLECKDNLSDIFKEEGFEYQKYFDSIPPKLSRIFFPKSKTEYLNFLCELHSESYKVVPVQETLNNTAEDTFIFTVERGARVYIIWENTNLSRATYIFKEDVDQYDTKLQFVFDYIVSDVRAKRLRLHSENINKEKFGEFEIVNHSEIGLWKKRLNQILS